MDLAAEDHVIHVAIANIVLFLLHRTILSDFDSPGQYMRASAKSCTKKGSGKKKLRRILCRALHPLQKEGAAIFWNLVPLVEDLHHVGQRAVLAVADDVRAPGLDLGDGVFGRKADLGDLEHRNIVVVVANAVNVLAGDAQERRKL